MAGGTGRRVRIVQVVLDLEAGGLERVVADLVRSLDPARFEIHVLALKFLGRHAEGLERFASLHVSPPLPSWTMLWPRPLEHALREIGPDVVHTHSGAWFKTAVAARHSGVRAVVHTEHGRPDPDPLPGRMIEYLASRKTDALIAVSADLGVKMKSWVASRCAIEVIPNGIATDTFVPGGSAADWRQRLSLAPETQVIGCVSRLDPIKDFPMLLEALAILRREWTGEHAPVLVLAGDGPERPHIDALIQQWSLENAVHLVGWVGATVGLYPLFDVFTLSSRSEGTSIALLEAMSAGVCPVVTAVGGNPSVLGSDLADLLVPSGAPRELAARWRGVLLDRHALTQLGQRARERVVDHYSLSAMVRRHEALYSRLASASSS